MFTKKMLVAVLVAAVLVPGMAQAQDKMQWDAMFQAAAQEAPGCWQEVKDFQTYTQLQRDAMQNGDKFEGNWRVKAAEAQVDVQRHCPAAWAKR